MRILTPPPVERERQEALKPDKGKLCAWADSLATMPIPKGLTTVEGKDLMIELDGKLTGLIVEIRVRANGL